MQVCLVLISAIVVLFWGVGGRDREKVVQCTCISLSQNMMYSTALALILQYMLCTEVQSDIQPVQTATNRHFVSHTKASCHKFRKKIMNCFINRKTVFLWNELNLLLYPCFLLLKQKQQIWTLQDFNNTAKDTPKINNPVTNTNTVALTVQNTLLLSVHFKHQYNSPFWTQFTLKLSLNLYNSKKSKCSDSSH